MNVRVWNQTAPAKTFMWSGVDLVVSDGRYLHFLDDRGDLVERVPLGRYPIEFALDDDGAVT